MFYIAIWPNLLLVFYCIVDEVSEIDDYGKILIRIEFSQVVELNNDITILYSTTAQALLPLTHNQYLDSNVREGDSR